MGCCWKHPIFLPLIFGNYYTKIFFGSVLTLSSGFLGPHERNFDIPAAMRAGQIQRYKLAHNPLGDSRNHGIYVIQALVEHLDLLLHPPEFLGLFCICQAVPPRFFNRVHYMRVRYRCQKTFLCFCGTSSQETHRIRDRLMRCEPTLL